MVCSHISAPPEKLYQCENGDIFCQECALKVESGCGNLDVCPECRAELPKHLSRNKALEKMARMHAATLL